jgi:hypothetical protein
MIKDFVKMFPKDNNKYPYLIVDKPNRLTTSVFKKIAELDGEEILKRFKVNHSGW